MSLCRLLRRRRTEKHREDAHAEARVEEAARRLDDLQERAERVGTSLRARRERNHWAETIASVYQGRGPA